MVTQSLLPWVFWYLLCMSTIHPLHLCLAHSIGTMQLSTPWCCYAISGMVFLRFNNLPCNVSMCSGSVGPFFDMILLQCCKIYSCWLMLMFMLKCCERKILFHGWKIVLNKLKRKMVIQSLLPWVFWYLLCILVLFITFVSCSFHSDHAAMCYLHHDVAMLSLDWLFKVQRSAM
jgi:hypothetical protein